MLDALGQALYARTGTQKLVHRSDRGIQYVSIRNTQSLAEAGVASRSAASAIPTTMPWPRPLLACTRPKSSEHVARGDTSTPSNTLRLNGSTGLTIATYSSRLATFHQRSSSRHTINCTKRRPWRRESTDEFSRKPGAVQNGVDQFSSTTDYLGNRSSQCRNPKQICSAHRSFGGRWSSWFGAGVNPKSWREKSSLSAGGPQLGGAARSDEVGGLMV